MIVGVSPAIRRALGLAERYARTRLPVLLVGATGTGKELFAEHIHQRSGRAGPLVDVNCSALPRDMVVIPEAQGKLLRVLESGQTQPLGAAAKRQVDLRVICAVQDDIWTALDRGRFRRDLFQRVAGVVIELPPLAARPEDIISLAEHFANLQGRRLEGGAESVLLNYPWPGNVRELRMAIERAGQLVEDGTLPQQAVAEAIALGGPGQSTSSEGGQPLSSILSRDDLLAVLDRAAWDVDRAATALQIGRTTFFKRLKALGISLRGKPKFTSSPEFTELS